MEKRVIIAIWIVLIIYYSFIIYLQAESELIAQDIVNLDHETMRIVIENRQLEVYLAYITSLKTIDEKAKKLGYREIKNYQLIYMK